jgi:Rrf2 family protein
MNQHLFGSKPGRSLLSAPTRYAILALVSMGDEGGFRLARDLSRQLGLPGPYLAKILQALSAARILESMRGPNGGFRLNRPAHRITLQDVVVTMEGGEPLDGCLLGSDHGGSGGQCPLHPSWDRIQELLQEVLARTTIRDLQLAQGHRSGDPGSPRAAG